MLNTTIIIAVLVVILAFAFDFINGFHDTANAIATSVSTRVLTPRQAIWMAAVLNFIGAFISEGVAKTIGTDILFIDGVEKIMVLKIVLAALLGAIIWNLATWWFGIPSSSSHALMGGLLGAGMAFSGSVGIVNWYNFFWKILFWLFASPLIGFVAGFLFMIALNWILRPFRPNTVTKFFSKAQIVSAALMAFNHGLNDAQKSMGIIAMALFGGGFISSFHIPLWVKAGCALAMAIGTSTGGWKIIKTMGVNMAKLAPVNGFAAETGAAVVIFVASMFHAPVSTTHIISTSIMGVGASKRLSSVRWSVAKNIVWAWVLTIPICGIVSALIFYLVKLI